MIKGKSKNPRQCQHHHQSKLLSSRFFNHHSSSNGGERDDGENSEIFYLIRKIFNLKLLFSKTTKQREDQTYRVEVIGTTNQLWASISRNYSEYKRQRSSLVSVEDPIFMKTFQVDYSYLYLIDLLFGLHITSYSIWS